MHRIQQLSLSYMFRQRYIVMKADAMSQDHRRQRYDWHKRDIMPKCVVSLARHWFPNPGGFPYMGHMWE